ncbi:MAG: Rrf2 family transcriptional regulator [Planctomycetes bacterium]|nr:Rrf2 family transcriptional regulator [Planctomycetota bacterium]
MLTATTELAIRALLLLGLSREGKPIPPRRLAETLACSPTYLSKTLGHLVRSGVLRSVRGARGGVMIARDPNLITLLEIVEDCQGTILGDYCQGIRADEVAMSCRYHRVMAELHGQIVRTLSDCTLAELLACPAPVLRGRRSQGLGCRMDFSGIEALASSKNRTLGR